MLTKWKDTSSFCKHTAPCILDARPYEVPQDSDFQAPLVISLPSGG